ncbi:hypothetical protein SteCoe_20842 [Stentor coeruleus]|uniref:Uncharacterized protein n=1 Tax=Stentor coeruleus TaxID=5963 RepID=A0A1R2BR42_9CILI|nr:hypothetical protein SteCoe_20842 [Stentor coeruleus]
MQEDKYTEIERENRILLEKIHRIMKSNKHSYIPEGRSLNIQKRKQLDKDISNENMRISKRLNSQKSSLANIETATPRLARNISQRFAQSTQPQHIKVTSIERPRKLSPLIVDIKMLIFKQTVILDDSAYLVEITKGQDIVRLVATTENYDKHFSVEISYEDAIEFMEGKEDWERLIMCLRVEGNEMILS